MLNHSALLQELGLESPKERRLLVELTVQISPEQRDIIYFYEGDILEDIAQNFCEKHQLNHSVLSVVIEKIKESLNSNVIEEVDEKEEKENYFSFVNQKKQPSSQLYGRLHEEAEHKQRRHQKLVEKIRSQQDQLNKSVTSTRSVHCQKSGSNSDLYQKALKQKEMKERIFEQERKQKTEIEAQNLTFRPSISMNSQRIVSQTRGQRKQQPEYYLLQQGETMKQQKILAEQEKNNQTARECSFTPELNKLSKKIYEEIIQRNQITQPKYEQLFRMQKSADTSQISKDESFTFKPQLNKSRNSYVPFLERQEAQIRLKEERKKQELEHSMLYDQKNGQQLYRPQILTTNRSRGGLSIGEYLYNKKTDQSIIQFEVEDDMSKSMYSERSSQIVNEMRKRKLEDYFRMLDSDQDGLISEDHLNIDALPTDAILLLQPVILQLEQLGIFMNLETWVHKCTQLVQKLNIQDKNKLFGAHSQKSLTPKNEFKPQINQRSKEIAATKRTVKDLYEKGQHEARQKEQKLKTIRQVLDEKENRQCTFRPKILK